MTAEGFQLDLSEIPNLNEVLKPVANSQLPLISIQRNIDSAKDGDQRAILACLHALKQIASFANQDITLTLDIGGEQIKASKNPKEAGREIPIADYELQIKTSLTIQIGLTQSSNLANSVEALYPFILFTPLANESKKS